MNTAAVVLVTLTALWAAVGISGYVAARRALRVLPGAPSDAPLHWWVSPMPAARAHRDLRRAARSATALLAGVPLADDAANVAVRLDARLVLADRLPRRSRHAAVRLAVDDCAAYVNVVAHLLADTHPTLVPAPDRPLVGGHDPAVAAFVTAAALRADALADLDGVDATPGAAPRRRARAGSARTRVRRDRVAHAPTRHG